MHQTAHPRSVPDLVKVLVEGTPGENVTRKNRLDQAYRASLGGSLNSQARMKNLQSHISVQRRGGDVFVFGLRPHTIPGEWFKSRHAEKSKTEAQHKPFSGLAKRALDPWTHRANLAITRCNMLLKAFLLLIVQRFSLSGEWLLCQICESQSIQILGHLEAFLGRGRGKSQAPPRVCYPATPVGTCGRWPHGRIVLALGPRMYILGFVVVVLNGLI